MSHFLLACRVDRGVHTALDQGWKEVARNIFERQDGERVRLISDATMIRIMLPSATVYLGYNWQFARSDGRPVPDFIRHHRALGGTVIDLSE